MTCCFLLKMALKILLNYSSTLGTDSSKNLVQRRGELWYTKLSLVLNTVLNFILKRSDGLIDQNVTFDEVPS